MRSLVLASVTVLVFGLCLYLQAERDETEPVKVQVRLVDENGKSVGGILRVFAAGKETPLPLPGLFDRLRGLKPPTPLGWHVVPAGGAETTLPRAALRLEAVSGLES